MNTTTAPTVFQFHDHEVRTIVKDGEPWFVASDVCKALNLTNSRVMLRSLDHDEKGVSPTYTLGGTQNVAVVNESGLYTLVLRCRDAVKSGTVPHQFRKWVTSEVIPAIRKTGEYSIPYVAGPNDILTAAQAEQLRATLKIACDKLPKEKQAGFMIKAWSKMKSHFGVSYRNIPQREFTEALSLAGRHAAEWEIVEDEAPAPSCNPRWIHDPEQVKARIRSRAWQLAGIFMNEWVEKMGAPDQFHSFCAGDHAVEAWTPSFGSTHALSTLDTLAGMISAMSKRAHERDRNLELLLENSKKMNGYETRRAA